MLQSDEKYARAIEYDTLGIELLARRMFLSRKGCLISESELENPFLLRAFRSAESCSAEAECTLDALDEALTDLQDDPELHELISQTFAKADDLINQCGAVAADIRQLRLKYRASRSTSGLDPETELMMETVARIQQRVHARKQNRPSERH